MPKKENKTVQAYIVSRAAQDIEYTEWEKSKTGTHEKKRSVIVKGGANVIDRKTLETPTGVLTPVSADELAFLKQHSAFQRHMENKFVEIYLSKDKAENEAEKETVRDNGSQLKPKDFTDRGYKAPKVKAE